MNLFKPPRLITRILERFGRSSGTARSRVFWIAWGGAALLALLVLRGVFESDDMPPLVGDVLGVIGALLFIGSLAAALTKYRLHNIDLVFNKTVMVTALALAVAGLYIGIVTGVGSVVASGDDTPFVLQVVAAIVVAIAFQPARRQAQKMANRLVYGRRATPYEVLADFSHRASEVSDEDLLSRVPHLIVEGTGAAQASLWIRSRDGFRTASSWPQEPATSHIAGNGQFDAPGADYSVPVFHDDELLGGISLMKTRGDAITPTEEELLTSLAQGMGLALRNTRLTAKLRGQIHDLERSRDRLVTAADEARRSLEHDLDRGPQQQLVAVKVKLGPITKMAEQHGAEKTSQVLVSIEAQAGDAIRAVRDFAGGIYPPLLEAEGLAVALGQHTRRSAIPVSISAERIRRYPPDVEAAVYFTVLEALQNAAKYSGAGATSVTLTENSHQLLFDVADDGRGFDSGSVSEGAGLAGMADRMDVVGGQVRIESAPGQGTVVSGSVPIQQPVPA